MNRKSLLLSALGLMMVSNGPKLFDTSLNPSNWNRSTEEDRMKAKGLSRFKFNDGFECWALNAKSADKKHKKWLNSKNL